MEIIIERYSAKQLESVLSVLAQAFVTSPLHVSAFGAERMDHNRLFFRIGLRHMFSGEALMASVNGAVCGYAHFKASPNCLPAPEELPHTMANLLKPLGDSSPRVMKWFARWCHLDPDKPHVHLGPIGVAPEFQGQGVGTALMNRYSEYLHQEGLPGYLETDKLENVKFYQKFDFRVQREEELIGTPVWYMWRERKR